MTANRIHPRLRRHGWTALAFVVGFLPSAAHGQQASPPGSLTILSRPAGASCRIEGDRVVVGRTPLTIERGLVGRYKVRSVEPGYEGWERVIQLSGATSDTLWMTLRSKNAFKAGVRSLILPGWGQFYSQRPAMGWTYLAAAGLAGAGAIVANAEYQNRLDDISTAVSLKDRQNAIKKADDAYNERQAALAVAAGVWLASFLDAMVFFPDNRSPLLGLQTSPDPDGGLATRLSVSMRF